MKLPKLMFGILLLMVLAAAAAGLPSLPMLAASAPASTSPTPTPTLIPTVTPLPATVAPTASATPEPTAQAANSPLATPQPGAAACVLPAVVMPTLPAEIPGYAQLDRSTNLHITGTYQQIDPASYRLKVTGKVDHPLSLTYDELRCMPKRTVHFTLICPGFFEDEATWSGVSLESVLQQAGVQSEASDIRLISQDGYSSYVSLDAAQKPDNLLAYEWEGQPLPILHGFPVRAIFPALEGNASVKWLIEIKVE
jgi:DMSO/TMAO reductase YedYZ molybdopterin-dependent catalytic subunit